MARRSRAGVCALLAGLVAGLVRADATEDRSTIVFTVDCNRGESIGKVLSVPWPQEVLIKVKGTCRETVRIARDNLTLRGITADAGVVGGTGEVPPLAAITVEGGHNVRIEDLVVKDADGHGITVTGGAAAALAGITVEQSSTGIFVVGGSVVTLSDSASRQNRGDGIGVWYGSTVLLGGAFEATQNGRMGLIVSGSNLMAHSAAQVRLSSNLDSGLWVQGGASGVLRNAELRDNARFGALVITAMLGLCDAHVSGNDMGIVTCVKSVLDYCAGPIRVTGNALTGVWADEDSTLRMGAAGTEVSGNGYHGIIVDTSSYALLFNVQSHGNGRRGLFVDGANADIGASTFADNARTDVVLTFGSRVSFNEGNTVGSIGCDTTVLTRGDIACPATSMAVDLGAEQRELARERERLRAQVRMLEP